MRTQTYGFSQVLLYRLGGLTPEYCSVLERFSNEN